MKIGMGALLGFAWYSRKWKLFLAGNCIFWYNFPMSSANVLTNKIIDYVYRAGGYAWRASSVGIFDTGKMSYRASSKKGVSDILSVYHGILIAIEVKIGTDRLSDEQDGFLKNIVNYGGHAIIAKEFDQFKNDYDACVSSIGII